MNAVSRLRAEYDKFTSDKILRVLEYFVGASRYSTHKTLSSMTEAKYFYLCLLYDLAAPDCSHGLTCLSALSYEPSSARDMATWVCSAFDLSDKEELRTALERVRLLSGRHPSLSVPDALSSVFETILDSNDIDSTTQLHPNNFKYINETVPVGHDIKEVIMKSEIYKSLTQIYSEFCEAKLFASLDYGRSISRYSQRYYEKHLSPIRLLCISYYHGLLIKDVSTCIMVLRFFDSCTSLVDELLMFSPSEMSLWLIYNLNCRVREWLGAVSFAERLAIAGVVELPEYLCKTSAAIRQFAEATSRVEKFQTLEDFFLEIKPLLKDKRGPTAKPASANIPQPNDKSAAAGRRDATAQQQCKANEMTRAVNNESLSQRSMPCKKLPQLQANGHNSEVVVSPKPSECRQLDEPLANPLGIVADGGDSSAADNDVDEFPDDASDIERPVRKIIEEVIDQPETEPQLSMICGNKEYNIPQNVMAEVLEEELAKIGLATDCFVSDKNKQSRNLPEVTLSAETVQKLLNRFDPASKKSEGEEVQLTISSAENKSLSLTLPSVKTALEQMNKLEKNPPEQMASAKKPRNAETYAKRQSKSKKLLATEETSRPAEGVSEMVSPPTSRVRERLTESVTIERVGSDPLSPSEDGKSDSAISPRLAKLNARPAKEPAEDRLDKSDLADKKLSRGERMSKEALKMLQGKADISVTPSKSDTKKRSRTKSPLPPKVGEAVRKRVSFNEDCNVKVAPVAAVSEESTSGEDQKAPAPSAAPQSSPSAREEMPSCHDRIRNNKYPVVLLEKLELSSTENIKISTQRCGQKLIVNATEDSKVSSSVVMRRDKRPGPLSRTCFAPASSSAEQQQPPQEPAKKSANSASKPATVAAKHHKKEPEKVQKGNKPQAEMAKNNPKTMTATVSSKDCLKRTRKEGTPDKDTAPNNDVEKILEMLMGGPADSKSDAKPGTMEQKKTQPSSSEESSEVLLSQLVTTSPSCTVRVSADPDPAGVVSSNSSTATAVTSSSPSQVAATPSSISKAQVTLTSSITTKAQVTATSTTTIKAQVTATSTTTSKAQVITTTSATSKPQVTPTSSTTTCKAQVTATPSTTTVAPLSSAEVVATSTSSQVVATSSSPPKGLPAMPLINLSKKPRKHDSPKKHHKVSSSSEQSRSSERPDDKDPKHKRRSSSGKEKEKSKEHKKQSSSSSKKSSKSENKAGVNKPISQLASSEQIQINEASKVSAKKMDSSPQPSTSTEKRSVLKEQPPASQIQQVAEDAAPKVTVEPVLGGTETTVYVIDPDEPSAIQTLSSDGVQTLNEGIVSINDNVITISDNNVEATINEAQIVYEEMEDLANGTDHEVILCNSECDYDGIVVEETCPGGNLDTLLQPASSSSTLEPHPSSSSLEPHPSTSSLEPLPSSSSSLQGRMVEAGHDLREFLVPIAEQSIHQLDDPSRSSDSDQYYAIAHAIQDYLHSTNCDDETKNPRLLIRGKYSAHDDDPKTCIGFTIVDNKERSISCQVPKLTDSGAPFDLDYLQSVLNELDENPPPVATLRNTPLENTRYLGFPNQLFPLALEETEEIEEIESIQYTSNDDGTTIVSTNQSRRVSQGIKRVNTPLAGPSKMDEPSHKKIRTEMPSESDRGRPFPSGHLMAGRGRGHFSRCGRGFRGGGSIPHQTLPGYNLFLNSITIGDIDDVDRWLSRGFDISANIKDERTALHFAAMKGHLPMVVFLVGRGADIDARDNWNSTPFMLACRSGHLETARYLLQQGADINAGNTWRATPLHIAASQGQKQVVQFLLESGADVNIKDVDFLTPLGCLKKDADPEIRNLLLKYNSTL